MRHLVFALGLLFSPSAFAVPATDISPDAATSAWIVEDHSLPLFTVKIAFREAGAAYDPAGKEGLASFAAQLFDEGAGDLPSLAYHTALEKSAIQLGAEANEDEIVTSLESLSEHKADALSLFALALTKPRFDAEAIERVRSAVVSELREYQTNPVYLVSLMWKRYAFPNHPYQHPRRGTVESVLGFTQADLTGYDPFCAPHRLVSFVGDITADQAKAWLKTALAPRACARPAPAPVPNVAPATGGIAPFHAELAVPQTVVAASVPGIARTDPRYYTALVVNQILGGGTLTSRLGREIRDKRGLAYYADSDIDTLEHASSLTAHFATRTAKADEALAVLKAEFARMAKDGVTPPELDEAKHYLTGSFPLQFDTQGALADYLLAMQQYGLGPDYLDKRNGYIEAVTLNDANALAKTLFAPSPLIVTVGTHTP